jgi:hypothetical protein
MKKVVLGFLIGLVSVPTLAQSAACAGIKQEKQRLACYDKAALTAERPSAGEKPTVPPPSPKTLKEEGEVFRSASWHVVQKLDAMTDKKSCTALYKNAWTVQGTAENLYVSLRGRGGVKAYTLRIDDAPADAFQMASPTEKELSAVVLKPSFDRIYGGNRVRLQIGTILGGILVEDIDLKGFRESVDYIRSNCEV